MTPLHKLLFHLHKPLSLLLHQLPRIPLPLLLLDRDIETTMSDDKKKKKGGKSETISVHLRLRPTKRSSGFIEKDAIEDSLVPCPTCLRPAPLCAQHTQHTRHCISHHSHTHACTPTLPQAPT